jgi:hypothetical protein
MMGGVKTATAVRLLFTALCVSGAGCTKPGPNLVKTKSLALNPTEYLGSKVFIQGKVDRVFPGSIAFVLSDDSGRIFVSTEELQTRFECPQNATVQIGGTLRQTSDRKHVYFSLSESRQCNVSN